MIDPQKCYQLYLACKAHFTTLRYDAVKHNARVKSTDNFAQRRDRKLFEYMARQFDTNQDCATFFVANFAVGNDYPLDEKQAYEDALVRWNRVRGSLTRVYTNDIETIRSSGAATRQELFGAHALHPGAFMLLKNGKIQPETLAILDEFLPFLKPWYSSATLWKPDYLRLIKLKSFVKYDREKMQAISIDLIEELQDDLILPG